MQHCKNCEGYGWYVVQDKQGKPVQHQCEVCHGKGKTKDKEISLNKVANLLMKTLGISK